jgi:biotin operon repressor
LHQKYRAGSNSIKYGNTSAGRKLCLAGSKEAPGKYLPVQKKLLENIASKLAENTEVIADYQHVHDQETFTATRDEILELLRRRPCSIEDIAQGLSLHRNEVVKYVEELSSLGELVSEIQNNQLYYKISSIYKPKPV